jgi:N-[(2S)-2-amino-2-carboxyethyl]-L-glutamate dehydrogenase
MKTSSEPQILYLCGREVEELCSEIDTVAVMRELFVLHSSGQTILPDEAYLAWKNENGEAVRSLNMPGYVSGREAYAGTKIINSNPSNIERGLPRASGLTILFDGVSTRITCVMEAAHVSALRTASVTGLAVEYLGVRAIECLALIGAGVLARAHLRLLAGRLPFLRRVLLFDLDERRAEALRGEWHTRLAARGVEVTPAADAREAITQAQLIVTATTVTSGYVPFEWLQPGSLMSNVSLDDPQPDVVMRAHKVIVDDWKLVKADDRRLLGRMYRAGTVVGPGESPAGRRNGARAIDAELGEVVAGKKPGRTSDSEVILFNPFGLAIEDVALATEVYRAARRSRAGTLLER